LVLYLDARVVFRADPEHAARVVPVFDDLGCDHAAAALGAGMLVVMTLVAHAGARRLREFFRHWLSSLQ
jgi:hypothetical protein